MSRGKARIYLILLALCVMLPFIFRDLWSTFAQRREFETRTGKVGCAYLDSVKRQQKFRSHQAYFLVFCLEGVEGKFKVKSDEIGFARLQDKLSEGDTLEVALNKRERETDGYRHAWGIRRNGVVIYGVKDKAKEKRGELFGALRMLALIVLMGLTFVWVRRARRNRLR